MKIHTKSNGHAHIVAEISSNVIKIVWILMKLHEFSSKFIRFWRNFIKNVGMTLRFLMKCHQNCMNFHQFWWKFIQFWWNFINIAKVKPWQTFEKCMNGREKIRFWRNFIVTHNLMKIVRFLIKIVNATQLFFQILCIFLAE